MNAASTLMEPPGEMVQDLAADLRQFLANLQNAHPAAGAWAQAARRRCQELSERFEHLRSLLASRRQALGETASAIRASLQLYAQALSQRVNRRRLRQLQTVLVRRYEDFVAQWSAARQSASQRLIRFRSLRLPKRARSILHLLAGVGAVLMYQLVLSRAQAMIILGSLLSVFVALEVSRRFSTRFNDFMVDRMFGAISRPQERYRVNSASYYLLALTLITWATPRPAACAAVLVLAFGDPSASWIGNRWGRRRLKNDKSLEGSLAFFLASVPVVCAYLLLAAGPMPAGRCLLAAAGMCAVGTLVELFSHDLDDNFSVPVACALTGLLWF